MSHDKANQSEVGEGPKAVDAALRRFVREADALETETPKTETPEAEATSDIESVEALLGDLELGADEATSTVVETIGELDDAAEDAAKTLELAIAEITKLGETDPKAADAALQRIAHAREAREAEALEAEAPSDIESVEHLLGDLDIVGDKSDYEAIEHLDELDACTEDTAKAKAKARVAATLAAYAAAKIKASVAQELTPALIEQTCGTDGPNTATPAVQVVAVAEKAEQTDIENLELVLGDLELGADETAGEVIEDMGELDAASEDAPINEIKREKAELAAAKQVDGAEIDDGELAARDEARKEPNKLREQMHAKLAEINGGVRVAPDDPLATDKICIARYLKKFGLTSDDLPDGFWDEPDEAARGWLLGKTVGPVMAERRLAKRVERSIKAGYPADYYSRP